MDYIFWRNPESHDKAGEKVVTTKAFKEYSQAIEKMLVFSVGSAEDNNRHDKAELSKAVIEIAVYTTKKQFNQEFGKYRPQTAEWLEHLRGYRGYITSHDFKRQNFHTDTVLWSNLPDALYAFKLFSHTDFLNQMAKTMDKVHYYGHFEILDFQGYIGVR